jgi:hypothetical protein
MAGVGLAGPLAGASAANLITNGSFEQPDIATGSFAIFANPLVPGWTHEPAPQAVSSSGLEIQDHTASGGAPDPTAGAQFAELDSDGPSNIYQDVATNPGATYRLTFLYSARRNTTADQNHFRVSAGPESVEIGPLTSTSVNVWVAYTLDFVATGTSSRIAFLDLGPEEAAGGLGAFIDLVSVDFVNTPPNCSAVAASPTTLWPPNHQLHTITLSGATDPDGPVTLSVTGVTQDEPVGGTPDAAAGGSADQVQVRAERDGAGDGRIYRISYTATDADGGTCSGTATVSVAHDNSGAPAVDSGASYDSFGS